MDELQDDQELTSPSRLIRGETQLSKLQAAKRALQSDFAAVAKLPEGRRVFHHIMRICGYHNNQVGGNPSLGMDVDRGTLYNCSRESVYIELREFIPRAILKDIEFRAAEEIE